MSRYLFVIPVFFCWKALLAQKPLAEDEFSKIKNHYHEIYSDVPPGWIEDDDWSRMKRAETFAQPRLAGGNNFDFAATWKAVQDERSRQQRTQSIANWSYLGPANFGGRVSCISIDPTDSTVFWTGGPCSGIWKTNNSGANWTDMSNNMPSLGISDIAIHPQGSNTIYVATGDKYATYYWGFYINYSMGVLKSTNGGSTWNTTGLSWTVAQNKALNRLIINPSNPNVLIAAAFDGIYRTADGGTTWVKNKGGKVHDVEFQPNNPSTVYAVTDSIFRSVDGGITWSFVPGSPILTSTVNASYRRNSIAVSPAAPNNLWVLNSDQNTQAILYLSTDGATTFTQINCATSGQVANYFGWYGTVLEVSPTSSNNILVSGTYFAQSLDGGTTWSASINGYVDQHAAAYLPSGAAYLAGNDGGFYKKMPVGYFNLNNGLQMTQFYRLGGDPNNSNIIFAGRQDGGTLKYFGAVNTWSHVFYNDGTEAAVDYSNSSNVYASYQYGGYAKSTDAGATFSLIPTGSGWWVSPFVIHPTNPQTLFFGGSAVRKSTDGGNTWNDISPNGSQIIALAVAKSNPNYIYSAYYGNISRTTNGGTTWNNVTSNLPPGWITYIAVSGNDPDKVWVTFSGYNNAQKVFRSIDGGTTWTNVSGTLPNVPVNCVEHDDNSPNDGVYIGTDVGVYYMDNQNSWTYFNTGLPAVIVNELEIHYSSNKIRAATLGRGMWECSLAVLTSDPQKIKTQSTISIYPNPGSGIFNIDLQSEKNSQVKMEIYNSSGQLVYHLNEEMNTFKSIKTDLSYLPSGIYFMNVSTDFESRTEKIIISK